MEYRKCFKQNYILNKQIIYTVGIPNAHIVFTCLECKAHYHIPKTESLLDMVADLPILPSKSSIKRDEGIKLEEFHKQQLSLM